MTLTRTVHNVTELNRRFAGTPRSCPACGHTVGTTIEGVCPPCYRTANNIADPSTRRGTR